MTSNSEKLITLAVKEFGQLTDAERKLFRAVARHEVANFGTGKQVMIFALSLLIKNGLYRLGSLLLQNYPNFKSDVDELNQPESAEPWGSERTLKADRLVWLLTTTEASKLLGFQGLRISGAKIEGELNLEYATIDFAPLIFDTCVFAKPLILKKSKLKELQLKGSYVSGIQAEEMRVKGSVSLCDGFTAVGEVNLRGASIGGQIDCSEGVFFHELNIISVIWLLLEAINFMSGPVFYFYVKFLRKLRKTAIQANAATIAAAVFLGDGFKAEGEVNLVAASIGGQLDCSEGKFHNKGQTAINADAAKIAADVFLRNGFKAVGKVNLRGASIGGQLDCSEGKFHNKGQTAINADAAKIAADVFLRYGFKAVGEVNLRRASIGGDIYCTGGQFLNKTGSALYAEGAKIGGAVFLGGGFRDRQFLAEGKMIFLNASIDDRFELESIESNNSQSMNLDLSFAKVNIFSFKGSQAEESWIEQIKQGQLCLNGFVYSTINVTNPAIKDNTLKKWLQLQIQEDSDSQSENGFFLQPYEQLAAVLKANGHQEAATKVLIAKEDDRHRYGGLTVGGKVWNRILGVAIAHGYRPQRALIYSVVVMLVGWRVFFLNQGLMTETNIKHKSYAVLNPLVYSIDTFTPIIDLNQQKMWLPDASKGKERYIFHPHPFLTRLSGDWLRRYFWFQIIAGWVLTSLWVAGFTGLVRSKD